MPPGKLPFPLFSVAEQNGQYFVLAALYPPVEPGSGPAHRRAGGHHAWQEPDGGREPCRMKSVDQREKAELRRRAGNRRDQGAGNRRLLFRKTPAHPDRYRIADDHGRKGEDCRADDGDDEHGREMGRQA